jgi:hypothetical protein
MDESAVIIEMLCRNNWCDKWMEELNPEKLIYLCEKNKVLSPLAHFIFENKIETPFKKTSVYPCLKESLLLYQRDQLAYKKILSQILELFSRKNIDICLLKGLSIPGTLPRDMGDLDLLIHPEDLLEAIDVMEFLGCKYTGFERNRYMKKDEYRNWEKLQIWSNQYEFLHEESGVLVELHSNFFESSRVYRLNLDPFLDSIGDFWERSVYSEKLSCKVLSPEDKIWLLSLHNSFKRSAATEMFALRNILDMKNLIISGPVDWDVLIERCRETGTLIFLIYTLEMTCLFFPEMDLYRTVETGNSLLNKPELFLKRIMHKCFYNLDTFNYSQNLLFRIFLPLIMPSRWYHKLESILFLPVLFPHRWRLRQIYCLPPYSKLVYFTYFLEPVRWFRIAMRKLKSPRPDLFLRRDRGR